MSDRCCQKEITIRRKIYINNVFGTYLTFSEFLCLKELVNGNSVSQTAKNLNKTERTVRAQLESCKVKLNSKTLFELGFKASKIDYLFFNK